MNQVTNLKEAKRALESAYRTYAFFKANKSQKRVMIAQDVIAQLKAKKFLAESGVYYEPTDNGSCTVCALGACFASACDISTTDPGTGSSYGGTHLQEDVKEKLLPYFSDEQLELIESAFERDTFSSLYDEEDVFLIDDDNDRMTGNPKNPVGRAINFGYKYNSDTKRLLAIMQNIVDNDGTFKP